MIVVTLNILDSDCGYCKSKIFLDKNIIMDSTYDLDELTDHISKCIDEVLDDY